MDTLTHFFNTEAAGTCKEVLNFWLYECSLDQAPSAHQVTAWQHLFTDRGGVFLPLADVCQTWLDEEKHT